MGKHVILRPHPETIKNASTTLNQLIEKYSSNQTFSFNPETEQLDQFLQSDVLITDWSGAAFDFALGLSKPVVFVNTEPKVNNLKHTVIFYFFQSVYLDVITDFGFEFLHFICFIQLSTTTASSVCTSS